MNKASRFLPCLCVSACLAGAVRPAFAQTTVENPTPQVNAPVTAPADPAVPVAAPAAKPATMPGFKDLFKPLGGDFRRMTAPTSMAIAAVGSAGSLSSSRYDANFSSGGWGEGGAFTQGKTVGSFVFQTGAAFGTYLAGRATGNERVASVGAQLFRAQVVSQSVTQGIKFAARRTRPDGTTLSFPSGHTSSAFATATVLQGNFGWKVGIPAYAMAAWIGASRMQMQRHYLSDVIAGATIGILAGRSVTFGMGGKNFAVSPIAAEGGVGVSFNLVDKKKKK